MTRAERCSSQVAARRLDTVLALFASGEWSNKHANRLAREWGVALRTVQDYSRMAGKIMAMSDPEAVEELRADTIVKLGVLHDEAKSVGEFRSAVAALDVRAKVAGVVSSGVTINNTVIQSLTVDQIRAAPAARELLDRVVAALAPYPEARAAVLRALQGGDVVDGDVVEMLPEGATTEGGEEEGE